MIHGTSMRALPLAFAATLILAACGDTGPFFFDAGDTGPADVGTSDTGESTPDAGGEDAGDPDTSTDAGGADSGTADIGTTDTAEADASTTDASTPDTSDPPDRAREAAVCERWAALRAATNEGTWSGNVGSCDAGDMDDAWRDRVLESVNTHRFLADLPPVTRDAGRDAIAQDCALMMHANDTLSHTPPPSWSCYTADGADGAGSSNIATAPAMSAMDLYMVDFGNESTFGHRRWFLSNSLGPIGVGSTNRFSCHYVLGGSGAHDARWTAWPPPGPVPFEIMDPITSFDAPSVDEIGWTVQSDVVNLDGATVTVTRGGETLPVEAWTLSPWFGSQYALAFRPDGWSSEAGATYDVTVETAAETLAWSVRFVTCAE